jgi:SAM-dependent methyltransferase
MPSAAQEHYACFLAEHYDWMFGVPFETKVAEQMELLDKMIGVGDRGSLAVDFGCGSGFQSLALSDLGYDVLAIDTSDRLLRILRERSDSRRIDAKCLDLLEVEMLAGPGSIDVAVCMGDTISHLASREAVRSLIRSVHRILKPSG